MKKSVLVNWYVGTFAENLQDFVHTRLDSDLLETDSRTGRMKRA